MNINLNKYKKHQLKIIQKKKVKSYAMLDLTSQASPLDSFCKDPHAA